MIGENIQLVLAVTGLLTAGGFLLYAYPQSVQRRLLGTSPDTPGELLVARQLGLLIGLVGVLLVIAAFIPVYRVPAIGLAAAEKAGFVALVLRGPMRRRPMMLGLALGDAVMVLLFLGFLVGL